jgi:hypothetical protein
VLAFGAVEIPTPPGRLTTLRNAFPRAHLTGGRTAGEISGESVSDRQLVLTAIHLDHPKLRQACTDLNGMKDSRAAGKRLGQQLAGEGLHNVIVFSQGVGINGSALIEGLRSVLPDSVMLSGGLAGDGGSFTCTYTLSNQGVSATQRGVLGFYDHAVRLRHGSFGGWLPFGPVRKVTRSHDNVLFELDGQPALQV